MARGRVDATVDHRFGAELSGTRPNPTYAVGSIRDVAEIRGYLEHPETEEELAEIEAWAPLGPELEPWE